MKIILELPDNVLAGFFNYIRADYGKGLTMCAHSLDSDDMHDGAVIKMKEATSK